MEIISDVNLILREIVIKNPATDKEYLYREYQNESGDYTAHEVFNFPWMVSMEGTVIEEQILDYLDNYIKYERNS